MLYYLNIILAILFLIVIYIVYLYKKNLLTIFEKIIPNIYYFSTSLSILLFLPFFYYINIIELDRFTNYFIFFNILFMLIFFALWFIMLKNIFVLFIIIANINLICILFYINNKLYNTLKKISIIGLFYLLFHHVFIDFFILGN
jgi:hypothetical protein